MRSLTHKTVSAIFFIQTKKTNKQNKTVFKIHKVFIYLLGGETATRVNLIQSTLLSCHHALFSSLDIDI